MLQESVREVKGNREMGERFMIFEEMLKDERAEGLAEGRAEGRIDVLCQILKELGEIPYELRNRIKVEKDLNVLSSWVKVAAKAESMEDFIQKIQ